MIKTQYKLLLVCCLISACGQHTTDASSDSSTDSVAAPAAPAASSDPRSQVIDVTEFMSRGANTVTLKNNTGAQLIVERVVVNGLEGDSACDKKIFEDLAAAQEKIIPLGSCGVVRKTKVYTDHGFEESDWTFEPFIEATINSGTLKIENLGLNKYVVQQVIINDQEQISDCNVKSFQDLAASSVIYIDGISGCGDIKSIKVITDKGNRSWNFN
jgi:hypothetical protein